MKLKLRQIAAFVAMLGLSACGGGSSSTTGTPGPVADLPPTQLIQLVSDTQGQGSQAFAGATALVSYTGWLYNPAAVNGQGTQFTSTVNGINPSIVLGSSGIIPGFSAAVEGWNYGSTNSAPAMRIGGTRMVTIGSSMAYPDGLGTTIPPGSALVFQINLLGVH